MMKKADKSIKFALMKTIKILILFVFVGACSFFFWHKKPHKLIVYDCFFLMNSTSVDPVK
jgi:hypothetical protein